MTVWRSRVVSNQTTSQGFTHQGLLFSAAKRLFPNQDIINNARRDTSFRNSSGKLVEVDIWIPRHDLCLEFQDLHHYATTWYSQKDIATVRTMDDIKRDMVIADNRSFVVIPCWWDGYVKRIATTVSFYRPDIAFHERYFSEPIPLNPNAKFINSHGHIPEIGELMLASFPEDRTFVDTISPNNTWWMGEKYDGVRFCWNATYQTLYSRKGMCIELSIEITELLPDLFLDGELWFGRNSFSDAQKLIKTIDFNNWWFFRMTTFDIPSKETEKLEFEERYRLLISSIRVDHPFAIVVSRVLCSNEAHLKDMMKAIVNKGGEGIILRQPRSLYERGRSKSLYKLKVMRGDSEAIVTSINEDQSVQLKLPSGATFTVLHRNVKVKPHPKKGDIVTFSYDDFSRKALPVNPTIFQIRQDLAWDDVVANYLRDPQSQFLNRSSQLASGYTNHPAEYWTAEHGKNMRNFLEDYARSRDLDPLLPETWYSIPIAEMKNDKNLNFIQYYSGGFVKALLNLFREIGLDESKFNHAPRNYWLDVDKRKQFFIKFAQTHSFDPLLPDNWYSIRHSSIVAAKGGKIVLEAYSSGSVIKALIHLFPDIGLDETKFVTFPKNYWQDPAKRKQFFIWFAKKKGFNHSVAENWYSITTASILPYKGARIILRFYEDSIGDALLHLFPNIGLQRQRFFSEKLYWSSPSKRRSFFTSFAARQKFDPLVPENWYSITKPIIVNHSPNAQKVLRYHSGDLADTLMSLFPDIGFTRSKFVLTQGNYWEHPKNLRNFFERFATSNSFDPLVADNWYSVPRRLLLEYPEAKLFLAAFKGNVVNALLHTFPSLALEPLKFSFLHKRRYFLQLAKNFGFDALVPENWYNISKTHKLPNSLTAMVRRTGSIPKLVLDKFKGFEYALDNSRSSKLAVALITYFPNANWEVHMFSGLSGKYWSDEKNRRAFFEDFANEKGFDPLVARNWYSTPLNAIKQHKNAESVLARHSNDPVTALMDLFPNIGFTKSRFLTPGKVFACKQLFFAYAKHNNFDPLVGKSWHSISRSDILHFQGASAVLGKNFNLIETLLNVFPDISGLDQPKTSREQWKDAAHQKEVFNEYAKRYHFDPLVLENWARRPLDKILIIPGVGSILRQHYNGNLQKALVQIYQLPQT